MENGNETDHGIGNETDHGIGIGMESDDGEEEVTFALRAEHVPGTAKGSRGYYRTCDNHLYRFNKKLKYGEGWFMYCFHARPHALSSIDVKCGGTGVLLLESLRFYPRQPHNHEPGM